MHNSAQFRTTTRQKYHTKPKNGGIEYAQMGVFAKQTTANKTPAPDP